MPIHSSRNTGKWGAMLAVGLSIFMSTLDMNIINVSLPTLVEQLNTDFTTIQWVIVIYVLVLTTMTLGFARLGDMFDKKKLFATGLILFTIASLLCALSPSIGWLIAFRGFQGIGAAMTQALGLAIITSAFPAHERGKAMGIVGTVVSVGLSSGPAIGGILIGLVGWRSIFLVNIPIGLIAVWAASRYVSPSEKHDAKQRFDFPGAFLLFVTLSCYALGMTMGQRNGFHVFSVQALLAAAFVFLIVFTFVELGSFHPMVDLRLFKIARFAVGLSMGFMVFIVISSQFLLPFFFELVKGYSPQAVGILMIIVPASMGLISPLAGTLSDRFGTALISMFGLIVSLFGCLAISTLQETTTFFGCVLRLIPFGLGMGFFQSPNNSAVMGAVPKKRLGIASGLLTLSRTLGHTSGIPISGVIFTAMVTASLNGSTLPDLNSAPPQSLEYALTYSFRIEAILIFITILLSIFAFRVEKR